jgi:hypothetical protein
MRLPISKRRSKRSAASSKSSKQAASEKNGKEQNPAVQQVVCTKLQKDRLGGVLFSNFDW